MSLSTNKSEKSEMKFKVPTKLQFSVNQVDRVLCRIPKLEFQFLLNFFKIRIWRLHLHPKKTILSKNDRFICSENMLRPTAQCSYALLLTAPSELRQTALSGHHSTFSSVIHLSYFIFEIDFPKHSTKAEERHPEGGARIILTKEVWKFS